LVDDTELEKRMLCGDADPDLVVFWLVCNRGKRRATEFVRCGR
jgi:hypothetical protein